MMNIEMITPTQTAINRGRILNVWKDYSADVESDVSASVLFLFCSVQAIILNVTQLNAEQ